MKRVITYGTFDLLHYGHINLLQRARALGDYLIVVLSTDEFNWQEKKKKCYFTYEKRKQMLEAIRYVDLSFPRRIGSRRIRMWPSIKRMFSSWEMTGRGGLTFSKINAKSCICRVHQKYQRLKSKLT